MLMLGVELSSDRPVFVSQVVDAHEGCRADLRTTRNLLFQARRPLAYAFRDTRSAWTLTGANIVER